MGDSFAWWIVWLGDYGVIVMNECNEISIKGKRYSAWKIVENNGKFLLLVDTLLVSECNTMQDAIQDLVNIETEPM